MKRTAIACFLVLAALLGFASPAAAGGWAVTTLDPLPDIEPGKPAVVGFTIRQHGVTPVDLTGVEIVVYPAGGPPQQFPAVHDGPTGHYVVELTVPAGSHRWQVVQGGFGPQDLGTLVARAAGAGAAGAGAAGAASASSDRAWPGLVRYGLLAVTVISAIVFVGALAGGRRRRSDVASA